MAGSAPKESLEVLLQAAHADTSLNTGSAAVMATSGVGSAALCFCAMLRVPGVSWSEADGELRSTRPLRPPLGFARGFGGRVARRPSPHEQLVGGASGFLCGGLPCVSDRAFFGTEVFRQVIQEGTAIGVGNDGAQAFHFVEFVRPFLASQVLLGDAAGVVARSAGGLHLGLHRSGRKRLAWGAGRLGARQHDGREQKYYRKNSTQHAGSLSQFSEFGCVSCLLVAFFCFSLRWQWDRAPRAALCQRPFAELRVSPSSVDTEHSPT